MSAMFAAAIRFHRAVPLFRPLACQPLKTSMASTAFVSRRNYANVFSGTGVPYADAMYEEYKKDPESVHTSWRALFDNLDKDLPEEQAFASIVSGQIVAPGPGGSQTDALKVAKLIRAYQARGHRVATLDPLGISDADLDSRKEMLLDPGFYDLTEADMKRDFVVAPSPLFPGEEQNPSVLPLEEIIRRLKETYCENIGFEYMFMDDLESIRWCREQIEAPKPLSNELRLEAMKGLIEGAGWEKFIARKFNQEKRFGLDGCEILVPGMQFLFKRAVELGVERTVIGMPHRGRLNVLTNIMKKPKEIVFKEFTSTLKPWDEGSGDVKYHLGFTSDVVYPNGKALHLSLLANPSHLEAVNPVVQGKVRATQHYFDDENRTKVLPVTLHGDAAFAGQGVVYETLGMSDLPAYNTGGTVHIVVNNQIGFTTDPRFARSSPYCTELAKMIGAPIMHVNGDDAEAVLRCFDIAIQWRQKFHKDVVIDIVCYRRNGHNEADTPSMTQPVMYKAIDAQKNLCDKYGSELISKGITTQEWINEQTKQYDDNCTKALDRAPDYETHDDDELGSFWVGYGRKVDVDKVFNTGVDKETIREIGLQMVTLPEDLKLHKVLKGTLKKRRKALEAGVGLDWGHAEALAFASLLSESIHVRLSGQDVERGTFTHRHAVLHDQEEDGRTYVPLQALQEAQAAFSISNSHLSEYGVLGFELGYSQVNPLSLVIWEAQFGDFSNTAQCIIDQFISSMEEKWRRQTGLVMLLPHGFEGMGPEHSSCRLERFLQMSDEDEHIFPDCDSMMQIRNSNWQVVNCTTPANYFHVLRRQVHRQFRKPLIVASPKKLLRYPKAQSSLDEISGESRFRRFIPDETEPNPDEVTSIVMCSGKVYYDLEEIREQQGLKHVAIGRVEQLAPFPFDLVKKFADQYPNAEIVWCQEEPRNMGPWTHVNPRIETALKESVHHQGARPRYTGRPTSGSVATGDKKIHTAQEKALLSDALSIDLE